MIAVIGANATQTMATGGVGAGVKVLYEITPLEGLRNRIGDRAELIIAQGYDLINSRFVNIVQDLLERFKISVDV